MNTKHSEHENEKKKVSPEVHDYLSGIGKKGAEAGSEKGGETTKELIDAGKEATGWNERDNPPIKKH